MSGFTILFAICFLVNIYTVAIGVKCVTGWHLWSNWARIGLVFYTLFATSMLFFCAYNLMR